jgi:CO/xanthine dehydrogenase Mo-binding subunit
MGFAAAFKNVGFSFGAPEQCWAKAELVGGAEIEEVRVWHAAAEVGQGAHTVIVQVAAEAAGVPTSKVRLVSADTAVTGNSGSVSASRMTFMAGNSVKGAVETALKKWQSEERPASAEYVYRPPRTTPFDPQTGKSEPNFAYGYVAQAALVEVDTETGVVRLLEMISSDDIGKAVNPAMAVGQIEGAVIQAMGYALMENLIQKDGYVETRHLSTYLIPTVLDIPDKIEPIILEYADPRGPWGARGMGEMPFLPVVPAIVDAIHNATGVWFLEFPLTPERILKGFGKIE